VGSRVGACPCRRTGSHFAATCASLRSKGNGKAYINVCIRAAGPRNLCSARIPCPLTKPYNAWANQRQRDHDQLAKHLCRRTKSIGDPEQADPGGTYGESSMDSNNLVIPGVWIASSSPCLFCCGWPISFATSRHHHRRAGLWPRPERAGTGGAGQHEADHRGSRRIHPGNAGRRSRPGRHRYRP
jgi:hypothetical protein